MFLHLLAYSFKQRSRHHPSMNSQVGGFAAMAGIDIGNAGAQDKATLAIAMLESRDF